MCSIVTWPRIRGMLCHPIRIRSSKREITHGSRATGALRSQPTAGGDRQARQRRIRRPCDPAAELLQRHDRPVLLRHLGVLARQVARLLRRERVLTGADGKAQEFKTGDAFIIPAGFEGTWETIEPVRKWYAIFEAKKG